MGWTIGYARVGNATPVYSVERADSQTFALASSVKDVARITGRDMKAARIACKEAREEGASHYLD
jgi:hypothetical protein